MGEEPLKRQPLNPRNLKRQPDEVIVMTVEPLIADQMIVVIAVVTVVIAVVIVVTVAIAVVAVAVVAVAAEAEVEVEVEDEAVAVDAEIVVATAMVVMTTTALVDVSSIAAVVQEGAKTALTKTADSVGEAMVLMSIRKLKLTCQLLM